jgi:hypothetical protein
MDAAQIAITSVFGGLWLLVMFILNSMKADITQNKADITTAKREGIDSAHSKISAVEAIAAEGKKLAIEAKEEIGRHRLYVASNHPTNSAIEKLERQVENMGQKIFDELKEISTKLDKKADKADCPKC